MQRQQRIRKAGAMQRRRCGNRAPRGTNVHITFPTRSPLTCCLTSTGTHTHLPSQPPASLPAAAGRPPPAPQPLPPLLLSGRCLPPDRRHRHCPWQQRRPQQQQTAPAPPLPGYLQPGAPTRHPRPAVPPRPRRRLQPVAPTCRKAEQKSAPQSGGRRETQHLFLRAHRQTAGQSSQQAAISPCPPLGPALLGHHRALQLRVQSRGRLHPPPPLVSAAGLPFSHHRPIASTISRRLMPSDR